MSFSANVKNEIVKSEIITARHCKIAALSGIFLCGNVSVEENKVILSSENKSLIDFADNLLESVCENNIAVIKDNITRKYRLKLNNKDSSRLLEILKINCFLCDNVSLNDIDLSKQCCKRAFIMGAFMASGSLSNPDKTYHLEIISKIRGVAELIKDSFLEFEVESKILKRKDSFVLYVKNSEVISQALLVMNASNSLLRLTNIRIEKNFKNNINRRVNFESSNICKAAKAASAQIRDIELINEKIGIDSLPANLQEAAILRLENRELSLNELSDVSGNLSKSCINHRLRKLKEIAKNL